MEVEGRWVAFFWDGLDLLAEILVRAGSAKTAKLVAESYRSSVAEAEGGWVVADSIRIEVKPVEHHFKTLMDDWEKQRAELDDNHPRFSLAGKQESQ